MAQSKAVATTTETSVVEQVLLKGDLASLTSDQRVSYYKQVCESVGLNPLTKPFEYITLNGKLTLYALRACTDQLRTIHGVSVEELTETEREGVFVVTAKVKNKDGRTDMSKGAVAIKGLQGEALANALMKTETKAKRRATLSICGLGFLDETEVETIPGAKIGEPAAPAPKAIDAPKPAAPSPQPEPAPAPQPDKAAAPAAEHGISGEGLEPPKTEAPARKPAAPPTPAEIADARAVFESVKVMVGNAKDMQDIDDCMKANAPGLKRLLAVSEPNYNKLKSIVTDRRFALASGPTAGDDRFDVETGEIEA